MPENSDYRLIWDEAINQIKEEISEQEFLAWFNLNFLEANENSFIVEVPSSFYKDQIERRFRTYIEAKIEELIGKKITITLEVKPRAPEKNNQKGEIGTNNEIPPVQAGRVSNERAASSGNSPEKAKKSPLYPLRAEYVFDTYVIGENNNFAVNVAKAIASNPGTNYNPFLIYGGVGLGKTHLMQAIGNYIYENSNNKVICVTGESFTNEFIASIKDTERVKAAFKNKYRHVDVLLIDDIHFFQGKRGIQEELFYTFEALSGAKKQMVFTCDRPPSELKDFNERLQSRVKSGINIDLQPPNYETRCAILKKKSEIINIYLSDEVISFISQNISTNVRDLEVTLPKLKGYIEVSGKPITVEIARELLKDEFVSLKPSNISIEIIQKVVAERYHLSQNDLKGKKKNQSVVFPRQLAMYIMREITEYTTTEIGQAFGGRDHTTTMHSCSKIEEKLKVEPSLESIIQGLIREIKDSSIKS